MSKKNEIAELFVDIVELCPHCGEENNYASKAIGDAMIVKCRGCGRWIVLCDRCEDHTHCNKCGWCTVAKAWNVQEGLETEESEQSQDMAI